MGEGPGQGSLALGLCGWEVPGQPLPTGASCSHVSDGDSGSLISALCTARSSPGCVRDNWALSQVCRARQTWALLITG